MIRNVHERELAADAGAAGALLDSVGTDDDRLWPRRWPPLRLDGPLAVGAAGGHGPIRYAVSSYEAGRTVAFRFAPGLGIDGIHRFDIETTANGRVRLRHELEGGLYGVARVTWPLAIRWLHDALLEDLLDRAQLELEGAVPHPARWSPWVRALRAVFARAPLTPRAQAERSRGPEVHAANNEA